jgi:hypothetical protein
MFFAYINNNNNKTNNNDSGHNILYTYVYIYNYNCMCIYIPEPSNEQKYLLFLVLSSNERYSGKRANIGETSTFLKRAFF